MPTLYLAHLQCIFGSPSLSCHQIIKSSNNESSKHQKWRCSQDHSCSWTLQQRLPDMMSAIPNHGFVNARIIQIMTSPVHVMTTLESKHYRILVRKRPILIRILQVPGHDDANSVVSTPILGQVNITSWSGQHEFLDMITTIPDHDNSNHQPWSWYGQLPVLMASTPCLSLLISSAPILAFLFPSLTWDLFILFVLQ